MNYLSFVIGFPLIFWIPTFLPNGLDDKIFDSMSFVTLLCAAFLIFLSLKFFKKIEF